MILTRKRKPKPFVVVPYTQMKEGQTSDKVWQEFFCRTNRKGDKATDQPGCGGYFIVGLSAKFTGKVNLKCPKCGHVHTRYVSQGYIQDQGRSGPGEAIDLKLMLSAWSQEPRTVAFHQKREENRKTPRVWNAVVIRSEKDLVPEAQKGQVGDHILRESWINKLFGSERDNQET